MSRVVNNILFILVIYKKKKEESVAYRSLVQLLGNEVENCLYLHDNTHHNIYLAAAYNLGLREAKRRGKEWIILLDDDTELNKQYIDTLQDTIAKNNSKVIAPMLYTPEGEQISPTWYDYKRGPFFHNSTTPCDITNVLNSGLAIQCETIESLGGFNTCFPLDYLDIYTCYTLYKNHIPITILPVKLQHNLSIKDYEHNVSRERYLSYLKGEHDFAYIMGGKALIYYRLRLFGRVMKWTLTGHLYIKETAKALFTK